MSYSLRLLAATIIGGILGFERCKAGWNAGIKTHSIICLGACLIDCVGVCLGKIKRVAADYYYL